MTIHQLQIFCAIVEKKSYKKAAEAFYLTVPSLSIQIRSLEKDLQIKLFSEGRSKTLTAEGKMVYSAARKVMDELEHLNSLLAARRPLEMDKTEQIRIMTNADAGTYLLPPILAKLKMENKNTRIILNVGPSAEIVERLAGNSIELGLMIRNKTSQFQVDFAFEQESSLVVYPDCPEELLHADWREVLARLPLIAPPPDSVFRRNLDRFFSRNQVVPNIALELRQTSTIRQAVLSYRAAAILTSFTVAQELEQGTLKEIKNFQGLLNMKYCLVRSGKKTATPHLEYVIEFLKKELTGLI